MTEQHEDQKVAFQNADFGSYIRGLILLLGILAGLWVTFLHPPLILTGGSGSTVNARARCAAVGDEFRSSALNDPKYSEFGFTISKEAENEARQRTRDCLKLATVNVPNAFLQIFVITAVIWLLMNFTRIIK